MPRLLAAVIAVTLYRRDFRRAAIVR